MKPESMRIIKRTCYKAERPEGQADLGTGNEVLASAEDVYDFRQDTHRKDILGIMVKNLLITYGHDSAAGIMRQDLEAVLAKLNPETVKEQSKAEDAGGFIWPE